MKPNDKTPVIFRTFLKGGDVIALFPLEPATRDGWYCESYVHHGQHGSADPHIARRPYTRPSTPAEIVPLSCAMPTPSANNPSKPQTKTTMKLTIEITMDNAAFEPCNGDEAERILRDGLLPWLASVCLTPGNDLNLRDSNGNAVGKAKVTK